MVKIRLKKLAKKIVLIPLFLFIFFIALVVIANSYLLPWYVDAPEVVIPELIGIHKLEAIQTLEELKLNPIEENPRYDENFPKDHVIYLKPRPGSIVKENRRVYLFISGGEPLVRMPNLVGKTLRDAKITIERFELQLGEVEEVESEFPVDLIVEQDQPEGTNLEKKSVVNLKVSAGVKIGMIRVPDLLGKSLKEAQNILRMNSLKIGRINYEPSPNLLPNTITDQYPSKDRLVAVGESVDVFVTKSVSKN